MEALGNNLGAKKGKNGAHDYFCEKCDFKCSKKYSWERHLLTSKHTMETLGNDLGAKKGKMANYMCELCDKCFNTNAGLWKHKKNCKNTVIESTNNEVIQEKNEVIQEKNDSKDALIQYLISENKEFNFGVC
jgi:hypothetical protein